MLDCSVFIVYRSFTISSLIYLVIHWLFVGQLISYVQLFVTPGKTAFQASMSFTVSQSLLKLMFTESVRPSKHLTLCHCLLFLPLFFPSIKVFSNKLSHHIKWPKYWSFRFSISPSNEYSGLIFFRIY